MNFSEIVLINLAARGGSLAYSNLEEIHSVVITHESDLILSACKEFLNKNIRYGLNDLLGYFQLNEDEFSSSCLEYLDSNLIVSWESYSDQISNLRNIKKSLQFQESLIDISTQLMAGDIKANQAVDELQHIINTFQLTNLDTFKSLSELKVERAEQIKSAKEAGIDHFGFTSGFKNIDRMVGYFQPGNLVIVAARPSTGKTRFLVSGAKNQAKKLDSGKEFIAIIEIEMLAEEMVDKFNAMNNNINPNKYRYPNKLNQVEIESLFTSQIEDGSIYYTTQPILPTNLIPMIRNLEYKTGKKCVSIWLDYLQLLSSDNKDLIKISRDCKECAKALRLPFIALSQLNTQAETKAIAAKNKLSTDALPSLANLSNASGQIGADADLVISLYRPALYDPIRYNPNYIRADLMKGRFTESTTEHFLATGSQALEPILDLKDLAISILL